MFFCTAHLHTVLYQPIRSLVFCSLMDYSSTLWICTEEEKQAHQGVLILSHNCGLRRQRVKNILPQRRRRGATKGWQKVYQAVFGVVSTEAE